MKKFLRTVLLLALVAAIGTLYDEVSKSAAPDAEEIYVLFENEMPAPDTVDPPELTEPVEIRGWKVWLGNFPRYEHVKKTPLDRRRDPEDPQRNIRIFREPVTRGARIRNAWLAITGQNP